MLASIIGVVLCAVAALVAFGNLALIVGYARTGKGGSLVPLFGGLFTFDGDWPKQVEPSTFYWIEETPTLR